MSTTPQHHSDADMTDGNATPRPAAHQSAGAGIGASSPLAFPSSSPAKSTPSSSRRAQLMAQSTPGGEWSLFFLFLSLSLFRLDWLISLHSHTTIPQVWVTLPHSTSPLHLLLAHPATFDRPARRAPVGEANAVLPCLPAAACAAWAV